MLIDHKVFYFDTETTGFDPISNDIIQLSGMIEINGKIKETFNFRCQPLNWESINKKSLEVTKTTIEDLKKLPEARVIYAQLYDLLSKNCDKYDKNDKFFMAGYNVRFDVDFLHQFFKKQGDIYFGSWFNWRLVDPLPMFHFMEYMGHIMLDNYKLETVCKKFGIELNAHDALSDITATREVIKRVEGFLKEEPF